ncbi:MAG TPA: M56 family metallopeptidase [Longimicrobium sp.]|jgi:beta-lactamase regulating signal transducer with metallopeptidase domain
MSADFAWSAAVWAANYLIHGTLLLCAAWAFDRLAPPRLDRPRELAWRAALLVPLVSATVQRFWGMRGLGPRLHLPAPSAGAPDAGLGGVGDGGMAHLPEQIARVLVALWVAVAGVAVIRLLLAHHAVRRQGSDRRPPAPRDGRRIGAALGGRAVPVLVSRRLGVPLAGRREIWLPWRALHDLTPGQLRAVLAHERAHVDRRDAAWRWAAALVERIFFFQPLNRRAAARLRELSETLCDELALASGARAVDLAAALLAVAEWVTATPRAVPVPGFFAEDGESLTVRRVRRILAPPRPPARELPPLLRIVPAAAACLALTALAPSVAGAGIAYVVSAQDPAGPFTLTVRDGRVLAATISGAPLSPDRVVQRGSAVELGDHAGGRFTVFLTPSGGIRWTARPARRNPTAALTPRS